MLRKLVIASRKLHCNAYLLEDGNSVNRESYETSHLRCSEVLGIEVPRTETLT